MNNAHLKLMSTYRVWSELQTWNFHIAMCVIVLFTTYDTNKTTTNNNTTTNSTTSCNANNDNIS